MNASTIIAAAKMNNGRLIILGTRPSGGPGLFSTGGLWSHGDVSVASGTGRRINHASREPAGAQGLQASLEGGVSARCRNDKPVPPYAASLRSAPWCLRRRTLAASASCPVPAEITSLTGQSCSGDRLGSWPMPTISTRRLRRWSMLALSSCAAARCTEMRIPGSCAISASQACAATVRSSKHAVSIGIVFSRADLKPAQRSCHAAAGLDGR